MATVKLLLFGALLYTCFLYEAVKSIPTKEFIPYGPRAGDSILIGGNISMDLENGFYMYEYRYDIANILDDGRITLMNFDSERKAEVYGYYTEPRSNKGMIFYRQISGINVIEELDTLISIIQANNTNFIDPEEYFLPDWALVTTWIGMSNPYSLLEANSFQLILLRDQSNHHSFAIYLYNSTVWPSIEEHGSSKAGFDAGDGVHGYIIPGSQTGDYVSANSTSNIGHDGMWIFRMDKFTKSLSSKATEFHFGFGPIGTEHSELYALISTTETVPVTYTVEAPGLDFSYEGVINPSTYEKVVFPSKAGVGISGNNNNRKGIKITSMDDKTINVVGVMSEGTTMARFPIMHQYNSTNDFTYFASVMDDLTVGYYSYILIVGMADHTNLEIVPNRPSTIGRSRLRPNQLVTFTMDEFDTLLLSSTWDITGTRVTSLGRPVAVFAGHSCTRIPLFEQSCDRIMEQLPSTHDWGRDYVITPLKDRKYSLVQIYNSDFSNDVRINCTDIQGTKRPGRSIGLSESAKTVQTVYSDEFCYITSQYPILVVQFSTSWAVDSVTPSPGGPAMIVIPSVRQYSSSAGVVAYGDDFTHYVNLVIPYSSFVPDQIFINNSTALSEILPKVWAFYDNCNIKYYAMQLKLEEGEYTIKHLSTTGVLGVIAYGHSDGGGYGYVAGMDSAGHNFEKEPKVKIIGIHGYGALCIDTSGTTTNMYWRDSSGQVISKDPILKVNLTTENYICEVPPYGMEPFQHFSANISGELVLQGGPILVDVLPNTIEAEYSTDCTFTCTAPNKDYSVYTWYGPKGEVVGGGPILTIYNTTEDSSGYYTCSVEVKKGLVLSAVGSLIITRNYPVILVGPESINLTLSNSTSSLQLYCKTDMIDGTIIWSWNEDNIQDKAIVSEEGDLIIPELSEEDAGYYECYASNRSGISISDTAEVTINVKPPVIVFGPVHQTILEDSTVSLTCYATGYAPIGYQWMEVNDGILRELGGRLTMTDDGGTAAGEYTCMASNAGGIVSSDPAVVKVIKKGSGTIIFEQDLIAFVNPEAYSTYQGGSATFHCDGAYGAGTTFQYMWLDPYGEIITREQTLQLTLLTTEDSGTYECRVFDAVGSNTSSFVELTVSNLTIEIIKEPCSVSLNISDRLKTATFECLSNLADASYIWEKKDGEIAVQAIGADASRLVIPNIAPSDSGDYRCIATSLLGENATSVYATLEINVELPVIKIPPVDVTTAYNGAVSLNCIAYGYGTLYVIWEKREVGIIQNSTAQVYYITDATATDVGSYRCRVISYQYETSVTSDFVTVTVRHSTVIQHVNCSGGNATEEPINTDLRFPPFLTNDRVLLEGPLLTTESLMGEDLSRMQAAMIYICHQNGRDTDLSWGLAIGNKFVLTVANCEPSCGTFYLFQREDIEGLVTPDRICHRNRLVAKDDNRITIEKESAHVSPLSSGLVLLQIETGIFLKRYFPKEKILNRKIIEHMTDGGNVEIIGSTTDKRDFTGPGRLRYRIHSQIPDEGEQRVVSLADQCNSDFEFKCKWIQGSPIIFQPPLSSRIAMVGLTSKEDDCANGDIYENHIAIQPDLEWIEEQVVL